MNNCFIILAAGESKRFNSKLPKPYHIYKGKALIQHSIDKAKTCKKINKVLIVINKNHKKFIKSINIKNCKIIIGGKTRAASSLKASNYLSKHNSKNVLIHDAARPNFSIKLIEKLIKGLKDNDCVVPILKTTDSVKFKINNILTNIKRENIFLTQTPQAFKFKELIKLQKNPKKETTDDANLFISSQKKIKLIKGENKNKKITIQSDMKIIDNIYYGIGFDVHRLVPGKKLYIGGVIVPSPIGTLGHSDGDPVLHALTDAILGACAKGDIGEKFSDKNKKFKNIRSTILLEKVIKEINFKGFIINNIDINIITERPKIKKYKKIIVECIAKICKISKLQINIKGKTTEKLGLIGKEKAIACEVIASVIKND